MHFSQIQGLGGAGGASPPNVHLRTVKSNIGRSCFVGNRIYRRLRLCKYLENISILLLYEQFSRNVQNFDHMWLSERISNC